MAPNTIVLTGYYADAVLKFTVQFPADYPSRPPVVHFLSDVFHPLIGPQDGVLNLKPRFRPWRCPQSHFSSGSIADAPIRPDQHRAFDVLHYIKAAFKVRL
jgi:hypothetical protein